MTSETSKACGDTLRPPARGSEDTLGAASAAGGNDPLGSETLMPATWSGQAAP